MANPLSKVRPTVPMVSKTPLGDFINQMNVPGMTPEQTRAQALAVRTGNAGLPVGSGKQ